MINSQLISRYALPPLFIVALSAGGASAKIRPAYIDDPLFCRAQPLPAVVQHFTGEAWKLDRQGKASALQEGIALMSRRV